SLSVAGPTTLTGSVSLGAGFSLGGVNVTAIKDSSDSIAATDLLTANAIKGKLDALETSLQDQIGEVSGDLDALNLTQIIDGTSKVAVSGGTITGTVSGTSVFDANVTRFNVSNELIVADAAQLNSTLNVVGATTVTNLQATSITETSSAALKTNVTAIDGALSKVMALRGVEFNWINNINGSKEYGLIAEDVAQVAPNLVSFEQEEAKGVKYSKMVSLLIEAMKEQQKEIDELKKKLN
ncbi:MAG: tail fiber domain-containing protein, partial [Candidatus Poseidoniales archaeon]